MISEKKADLTIFKISEFLGFLENFSFYNYSNLAIFRQSECFYNYLFEKVLNLEFFDSDNFLIPSDSATFQISNYSIFFFQIMI